MLLLLETAAGYGLFKVASKGEALVREGDADALFNALSTAEKAKSILKLQAFQAFTDTTEAVAAAAAIIEGKLDSGLKKFLRKQIVKKARTDELCVADTKLGGLVKESLSINCINDAGVRELYRNVRANLDALVEGVDSNDFRAMQLGLSHSLSRYKLKFSADKVDLMIVQAVGLLDELDKEVNTYAMRVREWYGWHFPEMARIINDNLKYARLVVRGGFRTAFKGCDFGDVLGDDALEARVKDEAEISMGTEISDMDLVSIQALARQVIDLSDYRIELWEYLKNRMNAIAPNLSVMLGELVGARLIAHAGSLLNLSKQPASTIQILGAEKALFRALKTKHDTPKYGLIYHASLVGQVAPKHKGKISRVLAAKAALAVRVDALGDTSEATIAVQGRMTVENRIRQLEGGAKLPGAGGAAATPAKYDPAAARALAPPRYNTAADAPGDDDGDGGADAPKSAKKDKKKKRKVDDEEAEEDSGANGEGSAVKKKKKRRRESEGEGEAVAAAPAAAADEEDDEAERKRKKKAKKAKKEAAAAAAAAAADA